MSKRSTFRSNFNFNAISKTKQGCDQIQTPPYINLEHVITCVRTVNLFKMNLCQGRPSLSATLEGVDLVDFLVITCENDSTIFTIVNNLIGMKMKLKFFHPRKIKNKNHLQALSSYHAHQEYGSHLSES